MNTESLQEFILKDVQNLRIAATLSEAWPSARKRITDAFLEKLGATLLKKLPEWEIDTWATFFEDPYASFYLYKPAWELYYVDLQFRDWGQNMRLGIVREETIHHRPLCPELLAVVRKLQPSAKSGKWWEAYMTLRSPATDWRPPEVLWRMHTDSLFLGEVAEQMLMLAKATEPLLDRLNKKKR